MVLDIFYPRPHYIMLLNDHRRKLLKHKDIYDLPFDLWKNCIGVVEKTMNKLGNFIFSIHLGFYQSKESPNFHAHYVMPYYQFRQSYIKRAHLLEKHKYASRRKIMEQAKYLKGLGQWKQELLAQCQKYKEHDLKQIARMKGPISEPIEFKFSKNYRIEFDSEQPRIKFIATDEVHDNYHDLVWIMMEYANFYGLSDRKQGGCHLCLQNKRFIDPSYSNIKGYLQVDIVNYYRLHPNRDNWLKNFIKSEYLVIT